MKLICSLRKYNQELTWINELWVLAPPKTWLILGIDNVDTTQDFSHYLPSLRVNLVSSSPAIWMTSVTAYSGSGEFYCSVFGDQICILGEDLHRKKYRKYEGDGGVWKVTFTKGFGKTPMVKVFWKGEVFLRCSKSLKRGEGGPILNSTYTCFICFLFQVNIIRFLLPCSLLIREDSQISDIQTKTLQGAGNT